MAFPLQNIELHVDDHFLLVGEALYEQGKVEDLQEIERHLWLAFVSNKEVEIQITPSKVRATTCECATYEQSQMCEHVVSVLLALRRNLADKRTKKEVAKKVKARPKKLTTATILEYASPAELKQFVRAYARSNRAFAIALKARFAADIPMEDDRVKYDSLLDTTIKSGRTKTDRIRHKGKQKILKVVQLLLAQAEDTFIRENFSESNIILQSIIEKGAPIFWKMEGNAEKYFLEIRRAFELLEKLLEADIAPELREQIWQFCLEQCEKTTYRISGFSRFFFKILLKLADDVEKAGKLAQVIDNQINTNSIFGKAKANLLINKLALLEREGKQEAVEALVFANLNEPDLLLYAVEQAAESENWIRAKFLAKQGLGQHFPKPIVGKIEDVLLDIAKKELDTATILILARKRFLREKDMENFHLLKTTFEGENWIAYVDELLIELRKQPFTFQKRDAEAAILAIENRFQELLNYIEQIRSLDLLQMHIEVLVKYSKSKTYDLYEALTSTYIKHHVGNQASLKIQKSISFLLQNKHTKLAHKLIDKFRALYPERRSLMDALS